MEENTEKYDPNVSATLQIQRSDESSGAGKGVGGVPGTTSNVPQKLPNVPVTNGDDSNAQVSKSESATYGVNKVSRHQIEPAGRIKRITAALLVDDTVTRKLEKNGKWTETRTKRTPQELEQLQTLAQNAIGLDTARGDSITVQNLSFASAPVDERTPATVFEQARKGLSDYSSIVRYAMLAVLFLMAYVLMIRPMQKKVLEQVVQLPTQTMLAELEQPLAAPALPSSVTAARQLREQLGAQVEAEPAKSARLLQAWLREEIK